MAGGLLDAGGPDKKMSLRKACLPPLGVSKTALLSAYNKTSPCTILRLAPLCSEDFLMAAALVNEKIEPRIFVAHAVATR